MVFHPDPAREYFEAGILPAPGHRFRVEVREKTKTGVSTSLGTTATGYRFSE